MSESLLSGQTAVVTGAGAGMGRAHAMLLARLGAAVVVNDIAADRAAETVALIEKESGRAVAAPADVSDPAGAASVIQAALEMFGGLHIVVSNAGIMLRVPFAELTADELERIIRVNTFGPFHLLKAAWPHLREQHYGRVVIVASSSAYIAQPLITAYAASKGALVGMAKTIALESEPDGITVNVLAPGAVTGMTSDSSNADLHAVQSRIMAPELVSPAVAWLVRPDNRLTGQIIEAASGRVALNFVGSTRGHWNAEPSVDDLVANEDRILDRSTYEVIPDTGRLVAWMTENTGWAAMAES
jgi:NAD(P)-dependent dehydrogenase (short-subunit alcohol dehydrogenase family)